MSYTSKDIKNIVQRFWRTKKTKEVLRACILLVVEGLLELCILQKHLWRKSVQILNPR